MMMKKNENIKILIKNKWQNCLFEIFVIGFRQNFDIIFCHYLFCQFYNWQKKIMTKYIYVKILTKTNDSKKLKNIKILTKTNDKTFFSKFLSSFFFSKFWHIYFVIIFLSIIELTKRINKCALVSKYILYIWTRKELKINKQAPWSEKICFKQSTEGAAAAQLVIEGAAAAKLFIEGAAAAHIFARSSEAKVANNLLKGRPPLNLLLKGRPPINCWLKGPPPQAFSLAQLNPRL